MYIRVSQNICTNIWVGQKNILASYSEKLVDRPKEGSSSVWASYCNGKLFRLTVIYFFLIIRYKNSYLASNYLKAYFVAYNEDSVVNWILYKRVSYDFMMFKRN